MSDDSPSDQIWLRQQLENIKAYFERERIRPPECMIVEFSLPPYLSLWSETLADGSRQIWVISGDCPTDYLVFDRLLNARQAMSAFAEHWLSVALPMKEGRQHPTVRIGDPNDREALRELGSMLESRARMLASWAQRDDIS